MQELAWRGEEDTTELLVVGGVQYLTCDINESPNDRWNSPEIKDSEQDRLHNNILVDEKRQIKFWLNFFLKQWNYKM